MNDLVRITAGALHRAAERYTGDKKSHSFIGADGAFGIVTRRLFDRLEYYEDASKFLDRYEQDKEIMERKPNRPEDRVSLQRCMRYAFNILQEHGHGEDDWADGYLVFMPNQKVELMAGGEDDPLLIWTFQSFYEELMR